MGETHQESEVESGVEPFEESAEVAGEDSAKESSDDAAEESSEGSVLRGPVVLDAEYREDLYAEAILKWRKYIPNADRVLLFIRSGRRLELVESFGSKAAFVVTREEVSKAIFRRVRRKQRALLISDALSDKELHARQSIKEIGSRSVLCVPLLDEGKTVGVVYADSVSLVGAFRKEEMGWGVRFARSFVEKWKLLEEAPARPVDDTQNKVELSTALEKVLGKVPAADLPVTHLSCPKPSLSERAVFFRALACMLSSGLSLYSALEMLTKGDSRIIPFAMSLQTDIGKGYPLSAALSRFPEQFGADHRHLINVGEETGTLDLATLTIADSLEQDMEMRGKLMSALTYPAIIAAFVLLACLLAPPLFLNDFFRSLASANSDLPFLTKVVMFVSELLWHPVTVIGFSLAAFASYRLWKHSRQQSLVRLRMEQFFHEIPAAGRVIQDLATLKFVRALGLQLEAGLYLDQSLRMAGQASGSPTLVDLMDHSIGKILEGESLAFSLSQTEFFSTTFVEFIRAGEETGQLGKMCQSIESLLRVKTEHSIEVGQALIEPLAMAMVGILSGTVALACLLPLVRMIQSFL